ncbi:MAG: PQQ-dependent dehydrogenase, methanol/ethanol family [Burkholderiaceae bacterium]
MRIFQRLIAGVLVAATAAMAASGAEDWPSAAHDDAGTRFSPLAEIKTSNVASLHLAWSFSTSTDKGEEAAPIVADGMMFVVTAFPHRVLAFDLASPDHRLRWSFDPRPDPGARGVACCDVVNRGAAYADGRLFFCTLDDQVLALDARTGRELWRRKLGDYSTGQSMTMAPLVVRDKVLVGNDGDEFGVRGFIAALDAASGQERWRAYSTGPDADVRIGSAFKPFYASDRGTDLGVATWPAEAWKIGGGSVGGWLSYDAQLDLLYHGTGSPAPANPVQRPGANKWTSALFARHPDSGDAAWAYQASPHDRHGYDGGNESVLVDLPIGGKTRRVLLHPDRNGYLYVIDRATGEVLSADAYALVTTAHGVDLATGEWQPEPTKEPAIDRVVREICPGSAGAKNWQPSAWSPRTRLLYLPHQNLCEDATAYEVSHIGGTPYSGMEARMHAPPGAWRGMLTAWDPVRRRQAWTLEEPFPIWSGALATAGDLVFYGTMDGWFKAVDARTGHALWKFRTASGIVGQPIAFSGGDGHEYVAVLAGVGGWAGLVVSSDLDTRDGTAARGFAAAMKDLPAATSRGGMLYVFRL